MREPWKIPYGAVERLAQEGAFPTALVKPFRIRPQALAVGVVVRDGARPRRRTVS